MVKKSDSKLNHFFVYNEWFMVCYLRLEGS